MASEGMFCEAGGVSVGVSQLGRRTIWAPRKQWPPHRKLLITCSGGFPSCLGSTLLLLTRRKCGAFDAHPLHGHLKQMWTFQERGRTQKTDILLQLKVHYVRKQFSLFTCLHLTLEKRQRILIKICSRFASHATLKLAEISHDLS